MLVLSRRPSERIVFPAINAAVQVVTIKPGVVRLGVEAPPEVAVFREEVLDKPGAVPPAPAAGNLSREAVHAVRNRLNASGVGLALLRSQLEAGMCQAALDTLARVEQEYRALRELTEERLAKVAAADKPKRRALIVEDDSNERELLAGLLRMAGMDVVTAGDGGDALDYLRSAGRPDVVLLDMVLPRVDGPSTVRAIRDNPACTGLKIFGVSGHEPERFALANGPGGIDRWYPKPLDPQALLRDLASELAG